MSGEVAAKNRRLLVDRWPADDRRIIQPGPGLLGELSP
jgi:hypothetical protein